MTDLQTLLSQPPASFVFSAGDGRTIGTTLGCIVDIWPAHVEVAALFPPDDAALAARNGTVLLLILSALRPDWTSADAWLATQLRAARGKAIHEDTQYTRRVVFKWSARQSQVLMRIGR